MFAALWIVLASTQVGHTANNVDPILAKGYELLRQKQYAEARTALEAGVKKKPSNALGHFYLADACRHLKDWTCAEEHYETSLDLDDKSEVADLAKTRLKKAKAWRLLEEAKRTISNSQASADKIKQTQDTLEIANKLGLDDEQQAVYEQLQDKLPVQAQEMPMVLVPAGEFTMGDNQGEFSEKPAHRVYLDAYYMDKYEVTVGMYAVFLRATGSAPPLLWVFMNQAQHEKRPVVNVDWADAATYCKWAGKRLPTEAEWEKAARGTDGRTYPWGNDPPTRLHVNFGKSAWDNHGALVPVGTLDDGKSPYGIYDMAGNVWEWVSDWSDANYYKNSPAQNPKGPTGGEYKVLRGGAWDDDPQHLRSAYRNLSRPTHRMDDRGFRCAKSP